MERLEGEELAESLGLLLHCAQDQGGSEASVFDGKKEAPISVEAYARRLNKYICPRPSPALTIVAFIYINRFLHGVPGFRLTRFNTHRLLLAAYVCACKFYEDE